MQTMKYVIIEKMGNEVPIIFPDFIEHDTFADMKPISAGKFFWPYENTVITTHGKSTSLKLESRPEDGSIIRHALEFEV